MSLRGSIDSALARGLAPFPAVLRWWAARTATASAEGETPWTPFTQRFADTRIAVVTTGGFHLPGQPGFDCDRGDPSWREIPAGIDLHSLRITHTHYDTRDAARDPNILLPLERLRELVGEGALGGLAPTHYSLMGYIPQTALLVEETTPKIAERMNREGADFALLTPA